MSLVNLYFPSKGKFQDRLHFLHTCMHLEECLCIQSIVEKLVHYHAGMITGISWNSETLCPQSMPLRKRLHIKPYGPVVSSTKCYMIFSVEVFQTQGTKSLWNRKIRDHEKEIWNLRTPGFDGGWPRWREGTEDCFPKALFLPEALWVLRITRDPFEEQDEGAKAHHPRLHLPPSLPSQ